MYFRIFTRQVLAWLAAHSLLQHSQGLLLSQQETGWGATHALSWHKWASVHPGLCPARGRTQLFTQSAKSRVGSSSDKT